MAPKAKPPSATCPKCGDNVWVGPRFKQGEWSVGGITVRSSDRLVWECSTCRYTAQMPTLDYKETV